VVSVRHQRGRVIIAAGTAALAVACLSGCGPAGTGETVQVPPARVQRVGSVDEVVLTPAGRQRIGIKVIESAASGKMIVVPFSALLYEPDGRTAVYTETGPLTFLRKFVTVAHVVGQQVFLSAGLTTGVQVVTVGAEELLGVQNGVGVET
jgi:hypothetical protein